MKQTPLYTDPVSNTRRPAKDPGQTASREPQALRFYVMLLFFYSSFIIHHPSFPQETGWPIIRNYTPKEYGAHPQVFSVLQDKNTGIMYFGIIPGLFSYDGIRWAEIPTPNKSIARSLCQTEDGKIYVSCDDDFGYLATDSQGKTVFRSLTGMIPDSTIKLGIVWSVKAAGKEVFFQTYQNIFRYMPGENKIDVFSADTNGRFASDFVHKETYHIRLAKKGLMKIENGKMTEAANAAFFIGKSSFREPVAYDVNTLLIATHNDGIHLYDPKSDKQPQAFPLQDQTFLLGNNITCAYALQKNRFALGSNKQGALLIDAEGNTLQQFHEGKLLQSNGIDAINSDNNGNLWLGLSNGLSKTEHGQDMGYWDKNAGLIGTVLSFARFQNTLYTATAQNIYLFDEAYRPQEVKGIPAGKNWVLKEFLPPGGQAAILLAGTQHGLYQIKGRKAEQIYNGGHAKTLLQSKQNPDRLYSTDGDHFISFLYQNGIWIPEGVWAGIQEDIRGIAEEEDGRLWLGIPGNGIIKITPDFKNITKPIQHYTEKDGLPSLNDNMPRRLQGKLIWGTEKGLYIHNPKTVRFEPFCGLGRQFCDRSRSAYFLQEMQNGKIYIASWNNKKEDIGYLKPNSKGGYDWIYKPFRRLPEIAGIYAMYAEESGILWIGGSEGVFRYDEKEDDKNYEMGFDCWVREVRAAGDSAVFYGGGASDPTLSKLQTPTKFAYWDNTLKFLFAAPFFDSEEKTLYSYKLEGFDESWSDWGQQTEKEYTSLWEGNYVFKVKAKNIYDVESRTDSYAFTVSPPYYRAWWAYTIYALLASLGVFGIVKANGRRLEADKKRLEGIVLERTAEVVVKNKALEQQKGALEQQKEEISQQAEELQATNQKLVELDGFKQGMTGMIVHDLKNPLSIIMNLPERDLATEVGKAKRYGKQMLNLVMDILDVQKYEDTVMKLDIQNLSPCQIAEGAIEEVSFLAKDKDIKLINEIDGRRLAATDAETLHRVFVNILTNAIKYTPVNGKIVVNDESLIVNNEKTTDKSPLTINNLQLIIIKITDTGQGIPADKLHLVFQKFGQVEAKSSGGARSTGLGMTFCKMAIEAHGEGAEIGIESEVGKGTTVWFKIRYAGESGQEIVKKTPSPATPQENAGIFFLSPEEKTILLPLLPKLMALDVYEVSEVRGLLKSLETEGKPGLIGWSAGMQAALRAGNEEKYTELLNLIDDGRI